MSHIKTQLSKEELVECSYCEVEDRRSEMNELSDFANRLSFICNCCADLERDFFLGREE